VGVERAEVYTCYDVVRGRIATPGPFEGCAAYVPFLWDAALEGRADHVVPEADDEPTVYWFTLADSDVLDTLEWPELAGVRRVGVWEAGGHVYSRIIRTIGTERP
jgi:hypothetical protein